MNNKLKKPKLTKAQIRNIKWLNEPKGKDAVRVGRFQEYWILSQNEKDSLVLVYNQVEWNSFIEGVKNHEFDFLIKKGGE